MPDTATAPTANAAQLGSAGSRLLGYYLGPGGIKLDCLFDPAQLAAASVVSKRLRNLHLLRDSIARTGGREPELMAVAARPAIGAPTTSSSIAGGTFWQLSDGAGLIHANKYTFTGGDWGAIGTGFPNNFIWKGVVGHQGNGADSSLYPLYGGRSRWACAAPVLEIVLQDTTTGLGDGPRVKVDQKYAKQGVIGNSGNGLIRYYRFQWGAGGLADLKERLYELDFGSSGAFLGIVTPPNYKPSPWPQADGLRVTQHGDSFVNTIVDSGDRDASLTGGYGRTLAEMIGQSDFRGSGTGGAGWYTPVGHTQSWFNDRLQIDLIDPAPDVVIDHGGGNDESLLTAGTVTEAQYQARVEAWIAPHIAANPALLIFMSGPNIGGAPALGHTRCKNAKAAAAAIWPKNVGFIDNLTDSWVFGTGRQDATANNGNRDWVTGSDSAHPTINGHHYFASRMTRGIAQAIPALIAAQG